MIHNKLSTGLYSFLIIPVMNILYFPLNAHNGDVNNLATALDHYIPFNKYFVIPYLSWYFLLYWVPLWLLFRDRKLYRRVLFSLCLGMLASYATYYFFQTMVFRPLISEGDVFCRLVSYVYQIDKPYNAFPSIHSLTSFIYFLAGYGIRKSNPAIAYLIQGLALAIIASTLLIKQHVILDVMGGVILGGLIYTLATNEMRISRFFYRLIRT